MSSVSMLSDYTARSSYEVSLARRREYNELKDSADNRKIATKVMAAICCPISNACGIFLGTVGCLCCCCHPLYFCEDEQNEQGMPYCPCSTCDAPCWAVPLPRDRCDMVKRIFDMCICCIGCSEDRPENYLLPEERQRYARITPDAKRQIIEDSGSFPSELTEMVISFDPLDIPPPLLDSYRAPIPSRFVDSGRVVNRGEWWMP